MSKIKFFVLSFFKKNITRIIYYILGSKFLKWVVISFINTMPSFKIFLIYKLDQVGINFQFSEVQMSKDLVPKLTIRSEYMLNIMDSYKKVTIK